MGGIKLGQPSAAADALKCETLDLPYECVNNGTASLVITCADIIAKALAGAAANGIAFFNGAIPSGIAPQIVSRINLSVACQGSPIKLDDGTIVVIECDAGGVSVSPNGGTNATCFSCGGTSDLGRVDPNTGAVTCSDSIEIMPGAGFVGCVSITQCTDKAGNVVPARA